MAEGWRADGAGFAFAAAGIAGQAAAREGALALGVAPFALRALGPVSWSAAGQEHQAPLALESLYPQPPALVAAFRSIAEIGLHATAFLHSEERGFGMDLRLTPLMELDRLSVAMSLGWSGPRTDLAHVVAGMQRPGIGKGVSASRVGNVVLLLDVGERGAAAFHAHGVECRLFDTFMEKGVISVARWAARPWTDEAALKADLAAWLDAPPAL